MGHGFSNVLELEIVKERANLAESCQSSLLMRAKSGYSRANSESLVDACQNGK